MFTRMDQSTQEEWQHISEEHMPHIFDMPKRGQSVFIAISSMQDGCGIPGTRTSKIQASYDARSAKNTCITSFDTVTNVYVAVLATLCNSVCTWPSQ